MTETPADSPERNVMDMFDTLGEGLACRVCGVLVAREGGYAEVHWDWHEASNGA